MTENTPAWAEDSIWPLLHPRGRLMSATLPIDGRVGFDSSGALLSRNQNGVFRWPVRVEPGSPERYHLGPPERVTSRRPADGCHFSMSRDGRVLAFAQGTHVIVVHRAPSQRTLTLGPQYDLRRVAVSPDGHWVVTGSHWADGSGEYAKLWDADTGQLVKVLSMGAGLYPSFSSDGRWVYCAAGESGSWYEVGSWKPKAVACPSGLLAPDGHLLACISGFGDLRLVHFETGKEIARISIPGQTRLLPESFSPDGAYLYAMGVENARHYRWDLRLIRSQLADLSLDMDLPPYPEPAERTRAWPAPLEVTLHGGIWRATPKNYASTNWLKPHSPGVPTRSTPRHTSDSGSSRRWTGARRRRTATFRWRGRCNPKTLRSAACGHQPPSGSANGPKLSPTRTGFCGNNPNICTPCRRAARSCNSWAAMPMPSPTSRPCSGSTRKTPTYTGSVPAVTTPCRIEPTPTPTAKKRRGRAERA